MGSTTEVSNSEPNVKWRKPQCGYVQELLCPKKGALRNISRCKEDGSSMAAIMRETVWLFQLSVLKQILNTWRTNTRKSTDKESMTNGPRCRHVREMQEIIVADESTIEMFVGSNRLMSWEAIVAMLTTGRCDTALNATRNLAGSSWRTTFQSRLLPRHTSLCSFDDNRHISQLPSTTKMFGITWNDKDDTLSLRCLSS